jgi:hypothetical protein
MEKGGEMHKNVAKALEVFLAIDPGSFDKDTGDLVKDVRQGIKSLLNVYDVVVPDEEVDRAALEDRARALALAIVDLAYTQPGILAEFQWEQVGEALENILLLLPRPQQEREEALRLDGLLHDLYERLDVFYPAAEPYILERRVKYTLSLIEGLHRGPACPYGYPRWWREKEGAWTPTSDPFDYGVEARGYAALVAKGLISSGVEETGQAWLARELLPLMATLPVATPEL